MKKFVSASGLLLVATMVISSFISKPANETAVPQNGKAPAGKYTLDKGHSNVKLTTASEKSGLVLSMVPSKDLKLPSTSDTT